jgi:oligopeptide transport system substrate-binding protein
VERYGDRWTQPENIVGNGPFLLRRWEARARLVLERNPTYWDAAAVRLERVVAYSVDDAATSTNLYKAGMLDWSPSGYVPSQYLPYMRGYADFRSAPQQTVCFYSINVTRAPLDDVWVRRALTYALDRETLARRVLRGTRPAWGRFAPGGYPGYEPPPEIAYDPARARECLSRAGYPGGQGFPKIEILINTSDDRRRVAEAVQAMWKQTLGIPVGVTNLEWASYLDATAKLRYQVAVRNWIGDYPDPSTFLNCYRSGDGNNRTGWSSGPYDRLLAAAQGEGDPAARLRLLSRAEAILLDEAPVIPVYQFVTHELVKPYVRGLYATPLDYHPLKSVWIDPGGATGANAAARGAP